MRLGIDGLESGMVINGTYAARFARGSFSVGATYDACPRPPAPASSSQDIRCRSRSQ
jgi:hypothetical protein